MPQDSNSTSDTSFVRVYLNIQYIVPATEEAIESAKLALLEDLDSAVKYDELHLTVDVEAAPDASWDDVPSWLVEDDETFDDSEEDA